MNIAVVIATYNRCVYLKKLCNCLQNQKLPANMILNVINVVDGSTDGTLEMLEQYFPDNVIVKGDGNWWWTKCTNVGFRKAKELKCDYILILNDDNEVDQNYIATIFNDFNQLDGPALLGSASVSIEKPERVCFAGSKKLIRWRMKIESYFPSLALIPLSFNGIHPTATLSGRGTFFHIDLLNTLGYLDEKLVQYGSDDEYAMRAKKLGIPVFVSWNAKVYTHLDQTALGSVMRKDSLINVLKSFFNPHSSNSLKKVIYLYWNYGIKLLTPFYVMYYILGTLKARFLN